MSTNTKARSLWQTLTQTQITLTPEMGITAALAALIFYLAGLWSHCNAFLRSVNRLSVLELALFAGIVSYLVGSMFGNTMYYTTPYFYLFLGATYRACRSE